MEPLTWWTFHTQVIYDSSCCIGRDLISLKTKPFKKVKLIKSILILQAQGLLSPTSASTTTTTTIAAPREQQQQMWWWSINSNPRTSGHYYLILLFVDNANGIKQLHNLDLVMKLEVRNKIAFCWRLNEAYVTYYIMWSNLLLFGKFKIILILVPESRTFSI